MMRRYVILLAAPIFVAALMATQGVLALFRPPRPELGLALRGPGSESALLVQASRAGDLAQLKTVPLGSLFEKPGLAVWDEAFPNPPAPLPGGGSPWQDLEALKDLAWSGSSVLLGYHCLAETSPEQAMRDLTETLGIDRPEWVGAYVRGLDRAGMVPLTVRKAWEAQNSRPWDLAGDGVFLRRTSDGKVLVLRRGQELGPGSLRVKGLEATGPDGYYSGWFCVAKARPGSQVSASFVLDLLDSGAALASANGLAAEFPALTSRAYGGQGVGNDGGFCRPRDLLRIPRSPACATDCKTADPGQPREFDRPLS